MSTSSGDALPSFGDAFASKYTLIRVVGEGGVGIVYEAQHKRLNQRVAIKVLRAEVRESDEWLARFDREGRAAVKLRGPNVARVLDVDSLPDGTPYMVMELLKGHDLGVEIDARKALPVAEAVGYMLEACAAMAEAHAYGIIHRDLTPRNLFLANVDGRRVLKVLDFGISKLLEDTREITATDAAFGTPDYVSPEQIRSTAEVDARADIWSLGVILFEMLTARLPFEAPNAPAVVAAVVKDPPLHLGELRTDLPEGLNAAVMKTLMKNPAERYSSVDEFASAIAPFAPRDLGIAIPASGRAAVSPESQRARPASEMPASQRLAAAPAQPASTAGWARAARRGWLSEPSRNMWIAAGAIGVALLAAALLYQYPRAPAAIEEPSSAAPPSIERPSKERAAPVAVRSSASSVTSASSSAVSFPAFPSPKPSASTPHPTKANAQKRAAPLKAEGDGAPSPRDP